MRSLLSKPIGGPAVPPKRHLVDVKAPPSNVGARGQLSGAEATVLASVPCSIEALAGRELELAHRLYAPAQYRVQMFADPSNPITSRHVLVFGSRRLNVGHVADLDQAGLEYVLLCSEEKS